MHKLVEKIGIDFSRPVHFGYSGLSDSALRTFLEESAGLFEKCRGTFDVSIIRSTIGTHIGPGAIGLAFFAAQRRPTMGGEATAQVGGWFRVSAGLVFGGVSAG